MKKLICILLVLLLLTACGITAETPSGEETNAPQGGGGFQVGYGKIDITPKDAVPLGGYSRSDLRISNGLISYIYATCLAVTDADGNTVLLFTMDLLNPLQVDKMFNAIVKGTGIAKENIVISMTHSHCAPDLGNTKNTAIQNYIRLLEERLPKVALEALEDRKPVTSMSAGSIDTEGMNFVRHYIMNDGTVAGDNFGDTSSGYARNHHVADPELRLLKFTREGGQDVYVTNFQTHPHQTGGSDKYSVSADIIGEYRDAMEAATGGLVMYFSGAGGNINSTSRIKEDQATQDFKAWGKKLAEYARQIELKPLNTGKVQVKTEMMYGKINHSLDEYAMVCKDLYERWDAGQIDVAEVKRLGLEAGITLTSGQNARSIYQRSTMPETYDFEITTVCFGDLAFVAAPCEMFDTMGVYIRENSPYAMTFIASLSNSSVGYLPTLETFEYGSYETDTCRFAPGIAEEMAEQFVSMLKAQYETR